jgi:hypothetical protein
MKWSTTNNTKLMISRFFTMGVKLKFIAIPIDVTKLRKQGAFFVLNK